VADVVDFEEEKAKRDEADAEDDEVIVVDVEPQHVVLECPKCDCIAFILLGDGTIECGECDYQLETIRHFRTDD